MYDVTWQHALVTVEPPVHTHAGGIRRYTLPVLELVELLQQWKHLLLEPQTRWLRRHATVAGTQAAVTLLASPASAPASAVAARPHSMCCIT